MSPSSATAGGAQFTLTIAGQGFVTSSSVEWNGVAKTTTMSSSTQVTAQITAADLTTAGSIAVSVVNPAPGGGNSGSAEFVVNASSNPVPSVSSLSPSTVPAGSADFLLTVSGTDFLPTSAIQWNGAAIATSYLSATQLQAAIPAATISTAQTAAISVLNPSPGGGVSTAAPFSVSTVALVVNQGSNDLAWDQAHKLLFVSVPSLASTNGNTITAIDPTTGQIASSQITGSEPDRLAISDDDQFLYVGLDGSSSVQRFLLPSLTPDVNYVLGADNSFAGPYVAGDLQVAPTLPHTTAVSRGSPVTIPFALGGMAVYDDYAIRPTVADSSGDLYDSLQWVSDSTIYANNSEVTSFDLYRLSVDSSGVSQTDDLRNEFSLFYISIHYDAGTKLIYTDDGYAIFPSNGEHVGSFGSAGWMIPDSSLNSAFFLGQTAAQLGTQDFSIERFNLNTYTPQAEIVVPNVHGNPRRLIRWGTTGLAFNDDAGYIYIFNDPFLMQAKKQVTTPSSFIRPLSKSRIPRQQNRVADGISLINKGTIVSRKKTLVADTSQNPTPTLSTIVPNAVAMGDGGFTLTANGTGFLSRSSIEWNGDVLPTQYVSSTQLQAQVPAADVASGGSASVSVTSPTPGGGVSNRLPFTVVSPPSGPSAIPVITYLSPDNVMAGSAGFVLTVAGKYFDETSVVEWNGSPRTASLSGTNELQVQLNASDVATPGYGQVTVFNGSGGGMSSAADFQILYQPKVVIQRANDMVWDPANQVIYISVPAAAPTNTNEICVLNPATATIGTCVPGGNEPDVLAISDDSQFLYVGQDGTGSVQRFTLPSLQRDLSYSLGEYNAGTPYYALDLQVAPGAPHTTAVTLGAPVIPEAEGGITVFDDSTPRPISVPGWANAGNAYDSLQWGAKSTALYAEGDGSFFTLTVNASGVTLDQNYVSVFWNPGRMHYNRPNGLIYSDDGFHAVDPSTGLPTGIFELGGGWPMAPDSVLNKVFILCQFLVQEPTNYAICPFDMTRYLPLARVPFSTAHGVNRLGRFIRWGTDGLAVNDLQGNIYLLSGSFVSAGPLVNDRVQ